MKKKFQFHWESQVRVFGKVLSASFYDGVLSVGLGDVEFFVEKHPEPGRTAITVGFYHS